MYFVIFCINYILKKEQKRIEKIIKRKNKTIKDYKRRLANYKSSFTLYN